MAALFVPKIALDQLAPAGGAGLPESGVVPAELDGDLSKICFVFVEQAVQINRIVVEAAGFKAWSEIAPGLSFGQIMASDADAIRQRDIL